MPPTFIDGPSGRLAVRTKGLETRPEQVVIVIQGANLSGQLGYHFAFDERTDYSFMEALVARGYLPSVQAEGRDFAVAIGPCEHAIAV